MTSCGRNLKRTLHVFLSAHVGKVEVELVLLLVEFASCVDDRRFGMLLTGEKRDDIAYILHAVNLEIVHHGGLTHVLLRHYQSLELLGTGTYRDGQHTLGRLQIAVKTQLADHHITVELFGNNASRRSKNGNGERQVEAASLLAQVCRRHVYGYVGMRKLVSVILKGGRNAVASLTYGRVAKACEVVHHPTVEVHLNGNGRNLKAVHGGTISLYEHLKRFYGVNQLLS